MLLVALTLVFFAVAHMGVIYLVAGAVLGGVFLWRAPCSAAPGDLTPEASLAQAIRLYRYSIAYLTLLFVAVAVDTLVVSDPGRLIRGGRAARASRRSS